MRNETTDTLGDNLQCLYEASKLCVNELIRALPDVFDITWQDTDTDDASFHKVIGGEIANYYYAADRDCWYCKF